ncbi:hypothetical protein [Anaeroselena agilis]|uniref:Uncharacterized protein n=1 Tax=Anaeroselena agilis TaxID=3063788 RepID=A0ABU3NV34_9FIRM|nr:hypothetical protein [Selenomonadales bacterium 4137-cl]
MDEWHELAEEVKSGRQPKVAELIEGIAEKKIGSLSIDEIAEIINGNAGQIMFCWE